MNMWGAIFDVDGVIVDVRDSYHYCIKETAEHFLKRPLDIEEVRRLKFQSGINNDYQATLYVIRHFGGNASLEDVIRVFDKKYEGLREKERLILSHEFFKNLRDKGFKLGVLTGRPRQDLEYAFRRFDLFKYFDCIVDDDTIQDVNLRKPHPYALNFCIRKMGGFECIYVGDSLADYHMWQAYMRTYGEPKVHYVHFGPSVVLEGVVRAENEQGLSLALQEALRSLE